MTRWLGHSPGVWGLASLLGGALVLLVWGGLLFQETSTRSVGLGRPMAALAQAAAPVPQQVMNADFIRVGLSDDTMQDFEYPMTQVSGTGAFDAVEMASGKKLLNLQAQEVVTVTREGSGFGLSVHGQRLTTGGPVRFVSLSSASPLKVVSVTRRGKIPLYRGTLEVIAGHSSPKKLSVVNVLLMQDYLKAVVPNELPIRYGYEAVKAQSVAARNYAIHPREKPWPQFDICDSQYCQAYYGAQTESSATTQALADTEGLVALYQGEPILALYSSSHGGYGENYSYAFSDPKTNQFPAPPIPYLLGGADVPAVEKAYGDLRKESAAKRFWLDKDAPSYDTLSPHYRWTRSWTRPEMEAVLRKNLMSVSQDKLTAPFIQPLYTGKEELGQLKRLNITERGVSGKAMAVEVITSKGKWVIRKEFVIRKVFQHGGRMLPSANVVFSFEMMGKDRLARIRANGGGFGHGVGMSQLGASWLDQHGKRFPQILQHYYKGVAIGTVPLTVGQSSLAQAIQTHFKAHRADGVLWVETPDPTRSVWVKVNGQDVEILPRQFKNHRAELKLDDLKPRQENSLTLFWDGPRSIKAWIEVYSPVASAR